MHVHVSVLDGLVNFAYMIIGLYALRLVAIKFPDSAIGQGASVLN